MATPFLETLGEHGESILATDIVPEEKGPDVSASGRKPKSDGQAAKKPRSKKSEVVMLSSSYTCWRKVPETWSCSFMSRTVPLTLTPVYNTTYNLQQLK